MYEAAPLKDTKGYFLLVLLQKQIVHRQSLFWYVIVSVITCICSLFYCIVLLFSLNSLEPDLKSLPSRGVSNQKFKEMDVVLHCYGITFVMVVELVYFIELSVAEVASVAYNDHLNCLNFVLYVVCPRMCYLLINQVY